jgi:hypothetical protein
MKVLAVLVVLGLSSQAASAITCDQVRNYVGTYGASAALAYAKKIGVTAEQIRAARSCLRRAAKDDPRTGGPREIFER